MSDARVALGKSGEDLAVEELQRRGYEIIARRWRRRRGEIDIIARDGQTLVFVEVKTREGSDYGGGADAVTAPKRRRIAQLALEYLVCHRMTDRPCRFDVVAIRFDRGRAVLEVFQNAFDAAAS